MSSDGNIFIGLIQFCDLIADIGSAIGGAVADRFSLVVIGIEEEVEFTLAQIQVKSATHAGSGIQVGAKASVVSNPLVLFQNNVQYTRGSTRRIVFRGWIGDQFDRLDGVCRKLLEGQIRWAAIYKQLRRIVAHGQVSIQVNR